MIEENRNAVWQTKLLRAGWGREFLRPADVGESLCAAMMTRKAMLEDANYVKIVPNEFIVEVSELSYRLHYRPIEQRVEQQWSEKLLEHLTTVNSRLGRKEYAFGGRVRVVVRPAADLSKAQARILFRVTTVSTPPAAQPAAPPQAGFLEFLADGRRFPLHPGATTIGRDPACDVCIDLPTVQDLRLVSGRHAYVRLDAGVYTLFDGEPGGKPSLNGTFVNGKPVPLEGCRLQPGDCVQLAAHDPADPRPETPGVAIFRFTMDAEA